MLDAEVGIPHRIVGEEAEEDVEPVSLVAEFVPDQQCATVDGADAKQQCDVRPPRQILRADKGNQGNVVHPGEYDVDAREPQIIGIGFHGGDHFRRRIVRVFADDGIERDEDIASLNRAVLERDVEWKMTAPDRDARSSTRDQRAGDADVCFVADQAVRIEQPEGETWRTLTTRNAARLLPCVSAAEARPARR